MTNLGCGDFVAGVRHLLGVFVTRAFSRRFRFLRAGVAKHSFSVPCMNSFRFRISSLHVYSASALSLCSFFRIMWQRQIIITEHSGEGGKQHRCLVVRDNIASMRIDSIRSGGKFSTSNGSVDLRQNCAMPMAHCTITHSGEQ